MDNITKKGYHLSKSLIPLDVIQEIIHEIDNVFSVYTNSKDDLDGKIMKLFKDDFAGFYGCAQVCQNLMSVTRLSVCDTIQSELKKLGLSSPSINTRPLIHFSSKHTAKSNSNWKLPAHQDWPSTQGSLNGVTCWIPLVQLDKELGPLEVNPGSHKLGYLDHEEIDGIPVINNMELQFESIQMELGDALFFSNFLIHRSGENTTDDRIRITTHFRYNDFEEPTFIDRKYPRHRVDKRKEGILFPGFPTAEQMTKVFDDSLLDDNR